MLKRARGPRPQYFADPAVDKLLVMLMTLAEEVSVLRERLDSFERVAAANGAVTLAEIEDYRPDEAASVERAQARVAYLERLLRVVSEEPEGHAQDSSYEDVVVATT